ncbi:MAG: PEP-CTERM sorting domain-containing protein [Burkholderiaceae bacterium]|nr:PEP-CTERM sorting domain-containing protein [Burkholderiaceae bacterium]
MKSTVFTLVASALTIACLQATAAPIGYHISLLPEGRSYSAFNDLGQAVSGTELYDSRSGSFTTLVTAPPGWTIELQGLNNAGDAYGLMGNGSELLNVVYHAGSLRSFAREKITYTHPATGIQYPVLTMVTDISNGGELGVQWVDTFFNSYNAGRLDLVTGSVLYQGSGLFGALSDDGSLAINVSSKLRLVDADGHVQTLPYSGLEARALNDQGQLAGVSGNNGFFYGQGVLTRFRDDTPHYDAQGRLVAGIAGGSVRVNDLNELGQVVGRQAAQGAGLAYLYSAGQFQYLNDITDLAGGWNIVDASAINELGQISARACKTQLPFGGWSDCAAVLLQPDGLTQPVPEPQTGALLAAGLGALAWLRRRAPTATASPVTHPTGV